MTEDEILAELGSILDQLNHLSDDAIAQRFELRAAQSRLRSELADIQGQRRIDAQAAWAEQAGRKQPTNDGDPSGLIPSPIEGGGGGGI